MHTAVRPMLSTTQQTTPQQTNATLSKHQLISVIFKWCEEDAAKKSPCI
jgi:hypothetical protein